VSRAKGADASVSILGTPVLRTEDPRFLTTGGVYTEDVLAVFTWPDLAALPPREDVGMLNQEMRQQPLATDIVRFVGKAVAAVVTQEPYQGEDAIELVSVDYTGVCRKPCSRHATRRYSLIRLPMRVCLRTR
jgi:carbon-monoxide dehydrogenase large subunit